MNNKNQALITISEFLQSEERGLLITGTNQYKKHLLIMAALDMYYKNAKILFRINALQNTTDRNFVGLQKQPKAGETVQIGNNSYQFDAIFNRGTWHKSGIDFDFAIVYPLDALSSERNIEPIADIVNNKRPGKLFLCSWTDNGEYDYGIFSDFFSAHVVYDAEEEDAAYHQRVLDSINRRKR